MIKYFHELTKEEFEDVNTKQTWEEFVRDYPQPKKCNYLEVVRGIMWYWSLVGFMVTGKDSCKTCDCYEGRI